MTYGPPEPTRAPSSPTILLLVSGLTGMIGFLIGLFAGIGMADPVAQERPNPSSTLHLEPEETPGAETTAPVTEMPTLPPEQATDQPTPPTTPPTMPPSTPPATQPPAQATDGPLGGMRVLLVGTDIQPGTYRTTGLAPGQQQCFWARLSSTDPALDSVIDGGMATGETTVTIQPTDKAFQTSGCAEWVRQG
ncbi:hypothetical protein [Nonomuraea soli]|uniref:Uncharacterized protein n=1 Tax=Nonomuraea soli TaxID=1032476 RepID=A0A7W0CF75_9ACTN|nr:hypothetical protein [Nonomuraea soli]MBA2889904.1 hypothetical protein [Nonomuraea soli]